MKKQNNHRFRTITKILLKHKLQRGLTPLKVRETIEDLGPTFVKLGQLMSTREDIIPSEYCLELCKLKENVKPLPYEVVEQVIETELNQKPEEVFLKIEKEPIGSASIGQVHLATLKDETKVVVKVMRPGIYEVVKQDFEILKAAIKYLNLFTDFEQVMDLNIIFDETWEAMKLEMNFLNEQNNIHLFATNNQDVQYIHLPKTFDSLTTEHILVMEYIDGIRIDDVKTLQEKGYDTKEICAKLVENFTTQVIEDGIFHADPHSGNILIRDGKIVWLDLGMIGVISKRDQMLYQRAIKSVISRDVYDLKNIVLTMGVCTKEINHAKLYQDIELMLSKYLGMDINDMDMGVMLDELMSVAKNNDIRLPKGMTLLGRSIIIIQKIVAILDPTANLMEFFGNHVQNYYKQEFDPRKKIPDIAQKIYKSASKSTEIPSQVYDLLNLTIKGQRHLNVEVVNLRENVDKGGRIVNRLIIGLMISSMILSFGMILGALLLHNTTTWLMVLVLILAACSLLGILLFMITLFIMIYKERKK